MLSCNPIPYPCFHTLTICGKAILAQTIETPFVSIHAYLSRFSWLFVFLSIDIRIWDTFRPWLILSSCAALSLWTIPVFAQEIPPDKRMPHHSPWSLSNDKPLILSSNISFESSHPSSSFVLGNTKELLQDVWLAYTAKPWPPHGRSSSYQRGTQPLDVGLYKSCG